jgi:beta-glucosidase-like glycosyl hydrolase
MEAGADMRIKPSNPSTPQSAACVELVRSERRTEKRIDKSARRVLAAKYDLSLVQSREMPPNQKDRYLSGPDVMAFALGMTIGFLLFVLID